MRDSPLRRRHTELQAEPRFTARLSIDIDGNRTQEDVEQLISALKETLDAWGKPWRMKQEDL